MMAAELLANSYGKEQVRVTRIARNGEMHTVHQLSVSIELEGAFEASYFEGDNSAVVATDSMKNTVYVLARSHPLSSIESFGIDVAQHFIGRYEHLTACTVRIEEQLWERIRVDGKSHPTAFRAVQGEIPTCQVRVARATSDPTVICGIAGLLLLKSTNSLFKDFLRDEFTTLPDSEDRIFSTVLEARWKGGVPGEGWSTARERVQSILMSTFAEHHSFSVQQTLYAMGEAVIEQCAWINEIELVLPNKHHLPVNLTPFNLDNPNVVFQPTDEPYGCIRGLIRRKSEFG